MGEKVVIKGVTSGGYWCSSSEEFRGIIFATFYDADGSWYNDLIKAVKKDYCEIVQIYIKTK